MNEKDIEKTSGSEDEKKEEVSIDFTNKAVLKRFVKDNIKAYNRKPSKFTAKELKKAGNDQEIEYTDTEIGVYLAERLRELLGNQKKKKKLESKLNIISGTVGEIDAEILKLANKNVLAVNDLKDYYRSMLMKRIQVRYEQSKDLRKDILTRILKYDEKVINGDPVAKSQINYIKNSLKHSVDKALYLALANGFTNRRMDINTGTKIANEGDSAQFLFLARAVLAGYTCSNVDVRSARYDAVIDYNGHLLRVQIKGISDKTVSFKDRNRGGSGIDPTDKRNKGKIISSKDIDLYVAVDKQFGICYIIPAYAIDAWVAEKKTSINCNKLDQYKENWEIISEVANKLFPSEKKQSQKES